MSAKLTPTGEAVHEGMTIDLVAKDDASAALEVVEEVYVSVMLEILDEEGTFSILEPADPVDTTPELLPSSPAPCCPLTDPGSTISAFLLSPLHGAAPQCLPASQAVLPTDLLRRVGPAVPPLTIRRPAPASVPPGRRPVQRRTARRRGHSWLGTSIKVVLLAIELLLTLMLATYAGVLPLLPATPPTVKVVAAGGGAAVQAQQSLSCWFTPGRGSCSAPTVFPAHALPRLSVRRDGVLQFTFNYPAPTACAALILDSASTTGAMKPLGTLLAQGDAMALALRTYRLRVALAPGTYSLEVSCRWHPSQTLRWLQGQGEASYWVALRVLPD